MSGGAPPRLAVDELAVPGEEGIVLRLAGHRRKRVLQAERAEFLHRMRAEIDADPERADIGRRLEYADAVGGLGGMRRQRQRQSANAAADDDEIQGPAPLKATLISHIRTVLWNLPDGAAGCNIACAIKDVH